MVHYVLQVSFKQAWVEGMADCAKPHNAIPAVVHMRYKQYWSRLLGLHCKIVEKGKRYLPASCMRLYQDPWGTCHASTCLDVFHAIVATRSPSLTPNRCSARAHRRALS